MFLTQHKSSLFLLQSMRHHFQVYFRYIQVYFQRRNVNMYRAIIGHPSYLSIQHHIQSLRTWIQSFPLLKGHFCQPTGVIPSPISSSHFRPSTLLDNPQPLEVAFWVVYLVQVDGVLAKFHFRSLSLPVVLWIESIALSLFLFISLLVVFPDSFQNCPQMDSKHMQYAEKTATNHCSRFQKLPISSDPRKTLAACRQTFQFRCPQSSREYFSLQLCF